MSRCFASCVSCLFSRSLIVRPLSQYQQQYPPPQQYPRPDTGAETTVLRDVRAGTELQCQQQGSAASTSPGRDTGAVVVCRTSYSRVESFC